MFDPPDQATLARLGRVVTLGMFIIDHFEVHDAEGKLVPADAEQMGGGGLYAMTAARQFLPPGHVGLIVDCGSDFPAHFRSQLESLGIALFRAREGSTTRALNIYSGRAIGEGRQTFKYLTPRIQITPSDYLADSDAPGVEWVHVVSDMDRAESILSEAEVFAAKGWKGKMAWEPLIRKVEPGGTRRYVSLATHFAIFSPNEIELQLILGAADSNVEADAKAFQDLCLASEGVAPAMVVRAGAQGAYMLSTQWSGWVPAYWRPGQEAHIVDVTGGGNAFIGGLLAGLMLTNDHRAAMVYASTAASFAIEQRGIPNMVAEISDELWNGTSAWTRLRLMAQRADNLNNASGNASHA